MKIIRVSLSDEDCEDDNYYDNNYVILIVLLLLLNILMFTLIMASHAETHSTFTKVYLK